MIATTVTGGRFKVLEPNENLTVLTVEDPDTGIAFQFPMARDEARKLGDGLRGKAIVVPEAPPIAGKT